ncbi:MAG: membrane protein insertion efficiency factor YidD [Candidatus Caldatribacteriota bacterium]|nr:membrane protein insertion efficiency factor YidD [Atribacterota bacterium]MDD3031419.1 membrane protein insertion efficiency factor YidD [Atribacterota bacterium]MDD4288123.1 membrane protein insertion efficiency factor YidD [Atribacterota bacterium]MDD4764964.1 membrane protein insertion efficiency factor YidD [Atribacterota bacterium]MDD5635666.1 membrane protein insertion efficiency factor YidD [Atribacterota bacterium]
MSKMFIALIVFYQKYISPLKPATCRFYPSCSDYAIQSIQRFGFFEGSRLAICRILRCHPYHSGGYDPVPVKTVNKLNLSGTGKK